MPVDTKEALPPEVELALAYSPAALRPKLATAFALDHRLGRIAAATTEPMLGQMRLAWWRDNLTNDLNSRPRGDAVLDAIGEHWPGEEGKLVDLVNGWEELVAAQEFSSAMLGAFVRGRSSPFAAVFKFEGEREQHRISAALARYFHADTASGLSDEKERDLTIQNGLEVSAPAVRLPKIARGFAVLEALSLRSLKAQGQPLMEGRGASWAAIKAAIIRS